MEKPSRGFELSVSTWELPTGFVRAEETLTSGMERVLAEDFGFSSAEATRYLGHNDHTRRPHRSCLRLRDHRRASRQHLPHRTHRTSLDRQHHDLRHCRRHRLHAPRLLRGQLRLTVTHLQGPTT
ncbi:NUDIX domain-containing protein [Streptomyces sp. NBRC 110611]|uniref:NUDIX domain-containing protein n=1 Tax=Streptomyces sp. NBRC 110611 TaxID=1621259 RepID=UPI0037D9B2FE